MGQVFFDSAPIGDPNDKQGQKLLTVELNKRAKPEEGMLSVTVTDVKDMVWIELPEVPYSSLILVGFPAQGVDDAEEMLAYLDKACGQMDDWKKRRRVILPKPADDVEITVEA